MGRIHFLFAQTVQTTRLKLHLGGKRFVAILETTTIIFRNVRKRWNYFHPVTIIQGLEGASSHWLENKTINEYLFSSLTSKWIFFNRVLRKSFIWFNKYWQFRIRFWRIHIIVGSGPEDYPIRFYSRLLIVIRLHPHPRQLKISGLLSDAY